jgi:hypothetical protein
VRGFRYISRLNPPRIEIESFHISTDNHSPQTTIKAYQLPSVASFKYHN